MKKSIEFCSVKQYKILGNIHTLTQLNKRDISGDMVKNMVAVSVQKMEIQKTYAVIRGNTKLLVLRINQTKLFIITCLVDDMRLKRDTLRLYV